MLQNATRKLAIAVAIFKSLFHVVDAKYCAFEIHGEPKYYVCPKSEYCCNFGCCVSPGFQIYHLWYYWLLVIVMFLICSGGGWWYRYWLQGRYTRATTSILPNNGHRNYSSTVRTAVTAQRPGASVTNTFVACQQSQHANITYNSARNTVLLHRMWKGPHRRDHAPFNRVASSSTHFQNTNVVLNDMNCPYYQLYGPPPSYETVIAQSRGKSPDAISNERPRTNEDQSLNLQYSSPILRCYAHSLQPNAHNVAQANCQSYFHQNCHITGLGTCSQSTSTANAAMSREPGGVRSVPEERPGGTQKNILHVSLPTLCQQSDTSSALPRLHSCSLLCRSDKPCTDPEQSCPRTPLQTNPSDNVILKPFSDLTVTNHSTDNRQPTSSRSLSNQSDRETESKIRLSRSKSLV